MNRKSYLTFHRIGVQLAHVASSIFFGNWFDVQIPSVQIRMRHSYSRIVGDDVFVYGLYCFSVGFYPSHLRRAKQMKELNLYFPLFINWFQFICIAMRISSFCWAFIDTLHGKNGRYNAANYIESLVAKSVSIIFSLRKSSAVNKLSAICARKIRI